MAYQKLQAGLAVDVIPSDTVNIPVPNVAASGANNLAVGGQLIDSVTSPFAGVKSGDIVYNVTTGAIAKVTAVVSTSQLELSANIFTITAQSYIVYSSADHPNQGCVLYVGGAGDLAVVTSSGSEVTLVGVLAGSFIPVQVLRVEATNTTATNIVALW